MPITILPSARFSLGLLLALGACGDNQRVGDESFAACAIEIDGTLLEGPDGVPEERTTRQFDADGRVIREDLDSDGDGEPNASRFLSYDEMGRLLWVETDREADGAIDYLDVHSYDQDNSRHTMESFFVRSEELRQRLVEAFDERGRMLRSSDDDNGDGVIDRELTNLYGPNGLLEYVERSLSSEFRSVYDYNAQGQKQRTRYYRDRLLQSATEHFYRGDGRLDTDLSTSGEVVTLTTYLYDEAGAMIGWTRDTGNDGSIDARAQCAFDEQGRMLFEDVDLDDDGIVDSAYATDYDEQGRVLRSVTDDDGDTGKGQRVTSYIYDCE